MGREVQTAQTEMARATYMVIYMVRVLIKAFQG